MPGSFAGAEDLLQLLAAGFVESPGGISPPGAPK